MLNLSILSQNSCILYHLFHDEACELHVQQRNTYKHTKIVRSICIGKIVSEKVAIVFELIYLQKIQMQVCRVSIILIDVKRIMAIPHSLTY